MEIAEPEGTQRREPQTATAEPMPDVESAFEEIEVDAPLVGIIMGSSPERACPPRSLAWPRPTRTCP
jgi:hypothetical protein